MDVSENSGTPKSSILIGFSIINHPFWGATIFRKHPSNISHNQHTVSKAPEPPKKTHEFFFWGATPLCSADQESGEHLGTAVIPLLDCLPPSSRKHKVSLQGETLGFFFDFLVEGKVLPQNTQEKGGKG